MVSKYLVVGFFFKIHLYVHECWPSCVHVHHIVQCSWREEEGMEESNEPPCGCWKPNSDPLKEQQGHWAISPAPQQTFVHELMTDYICACVRVYRQEPQQASEGQRTTWRSQFSAPIRVLWLELRSYGVQCICLVTHIWPEQSLLFVSDREPEKGLLLHSAWNKDLHLKHIHSTELWACMKTFFQVILIMSLASIISFIIRVADITTEHYETDMTVCVSCRRTTEYGCPWSRIHWLQLELDLEVVASCLM